MQFSTATSLVSCDQAAMRLSEVNTSISNGAASTFTKGEQRAPSEAAMALPQTHRSVSGDNPGWLQTLRWAANTRTTTGSADARRREERPLNWRRRQSPALAVGNIVKLGGGEGRPEAFIYGTGIHASASCVTLTSVRSRPTCNAVMFLAVAIHFASMSVTSWVNSVSRSSSC